MAPSLVRAWFRAFVATQVIETPIVVWLTRDVPMPAWRRTVIALLANLATHPIVWFVVPVLGPRGLPELVIAETWAVVVEWLFYFVTLPSMKLTRALGLSAFANGMSFAIGLVLFQLTGWLG